MRVRGGAVTGGRGNAFGGSGESSAARAAGPASASFDFEHDPFALAGEGCWEE
jgi:hypothetical protein